jgi:hypothetical protein
MGMQEVLNPVEAGQLLHRRDELIRRHEKLTERVALFANAVNRQQLNELTSEISRVRQRLVDLGGA